MVALLLTGRISRPALRSPCRRTKPWTPGAPSCFVLCAWLLPFLAGCAFFVPRSGLNWGRQGMPIVTVPGELHARPRLVLGPAAPSGREWPTSDLSHVKPPPEPGQDISPECPLSLRPPAATYSGSDSVRTAGVSRGFSVPMAAHLSSPASPSVWLCLCRRKWTLHFR